MIGTVALGSALRATCSFIFDNPVGKSLAAGSLVVVAFFVWLMSHDAKVAREAKTEVVSELNTQTEKMTNDGLKARDGALAPGSWERLRRTHCRDCD